MTSVFRRRNNPHQDQEDDSTKKQIKINELKAAIGPLTGRNSLYCTNECFKRYLEARNWNLDKSKKMLEDTLKWRSSFKPEEIRWDQVAAEGETGKIFRANFHDRSGRSVIIMRPAYQNTTDSENQIRHLVYLLENAVLNLPEGQEQMVWLIDFTGLTLTTSVSIKTARETVNILQNHYPERLSLAFLYNPPRVFQAFWKIVKYFLDTKTFHKVKFVYPKNKESVELMKQYFDEENLPTEFGGKTALAYDHDEFSRLMIQDDLKSAALWGSSNEKLNNGSSVAEVAPEPAS